MHLRASPITSRLAILVALAAMARPGRQAPSADRLPIPPQSQQVPVLQALRETFKPRLADPNDRLSLPAELRQQASGFDKDPTGRYVYINEARRLSLEAMDLDAALQAIGDLSLYFLVDTIALQIEAVATVASNARQEEVNEVATQALDLVEELMSLSDLTSAERVLKAVTPLGTKLSEPGVQSRWISTNWHLSTRKEVDRARDKLLRDPDDARSLETLGRYMCLVENDYEHGLPVLNRVPRERSRDKALQRLAEDDSLGALEAQGRFQLGTRWLELAKSLKPMERKGPSLRAIYWFEQAQPAFTGTSNGVVLTEKLKEARAMELAPSPMEALAAAPRSQKGKRSAILNAELVVNGDCEEKANTSGVPHWEIVSGDWIPLGTVGDGYDFRDNRSGAFFFRPVGKQFVEELRQDIDISQVWKEARGGGTVVVTVGARIRAHFQRDVGEECQVVVEFINASGQVIGTSLSCEPTYSGTWLDIALSGDVPKLAQKIRLRLVSYRKSGTSNDGFFDNLSLKLSSVPR